ncbi:septum formation initiator family protein [Corynebacterium mendelii]|uniref:Septum formation initiator family protein n=1 Tax=Corynebacterium mendelii TaxID=2765362 RepID=A0A939E0M3_9CORY|nr:septum formation initiator family protein [Corynebacterium mendelii]MBN9644770.1 septum formation initiator family protein [Corynebacterium mendelii]
MAPLPSKRSRRPVPVAHRRDNQAARSRTGSRLRLSDFKFTALQMGVLGLCAVMIVLMISMPVRNYFQQRGEIARLTASVEAKQAEKQRLLDEIDKQRSDAYLKEQARVRLGVIEPGETAFRIMVPVPEDPADGPTTPDGTPTGELGPWWEVMWDSIADPGAAPVLPEHRPADDGQPDAPENQQTPFDGIGTVDSSIFDPDHDPLAPADDPQPPADNPQPPAEQPDSGGHTDNAPPA